MSNYGELLKKLTSVGSALAESIRGSAREQDTQTKSSLMAQKNLKESMDRIRDTKGFSDANMSLFRIFADMDKVEKKYDIIESPESIEGYRGTYNDTSIFGLNYDEDISTFQQLADAHEGMGSYDTLFENESKIKDSPFYGVDITNKTLGEILNFTSGNSEYLKYNVNKYGKNTTAVGRYQFVGKTLKDIVERGDFDLNRKFDADLQDELFKWYMDDTLKVGNRTGVTMDDKIDAVIGRWEGFKNASREDIRSAIEQYELQSITRNLPQNRPRGLMNRQEGI